MEKRSLEAETALDFLSGIIDLVADRNELSNIESEAVTASIHFYAVAEAGREKIDFIKRYVNECEREIFLPQKTSVDVSGRERVDNFLSEDENLKTLHEFRDQVSLNLLRMSDYDLEGDRLSLINGFNILNKLLILASGYNRIVST